MRKRGLLSSQCVSQWLGVHTPRSVFLLALLYDWEFQRLKGTTLISNIILLLSQKSLWLVVRITVAQVCWNLLVAHTPQKLSFKAVN